MSRGYTPLPMGFGSRGGVYRANRSSGTIWSIPWRVSLGSTADMHAWHCTRYTYISDSSSWSVEIFCWTSIRNCVSTKKWRLNSCFWEQYESLHLAAKGIDVSHLFFSPVFVFSFLNISELCLWPPKCIVIIAVPCRKTSGSFQSNGRAETGLLLRNAGACSKNAKQCTFWLAFFISPAVNNLHITIYFMPQYDSTANTIVKSLSNWQPLLRIESTTWKWQ